MVWEEGAAIFVPNDISHSYKKFFDIFVTLELNINFLCKEGKYIFVAIATKTQKAAKGGSNFGNIFPLAILSLASCSPAELVSFSDSTAKIKMILFS